MVVVAAVTSVTAPLSLQCLLTNFLPTLWEQFASGPAFHDNVLLMITGALEHPWLLALCLIILLGVAATPIFARRL